MAHIYLSFIVLFMPFFLSFRTHYLYLYARLIVEGEDGSRGGLLLNMDDALVLPNMSIHTSLSLFFNLCLYVFRAFQDHVVYHCERRVSSIPTVLCLLLIQSRYMDLCSFERPRMGRIVCCEVCIQETIHATSNERDKATYRCEPVQTAQEQKEDINESRRPAAS